MENARDFGVSCVCGARPAGESHHFFLLLSEMGDARESWFERW